MSSGGRALIGIVLGLIAGLVIVKLADDVLLRQGDQLRGGAAAIIVLIVTVLGVAAAASSGPRPPAA